jgi:hypothetical protein
MPLTIVGELIKIPKLWTKPEFATSLELTDFQAANRKSCMNRPQGELSAKPQCPQCVGSTIIPRYINSIL